MPYKYVLTPNILEKSINAYVSQLKENGFSYPNQKGWLTLLRDLLSPDLLLEHKPLAKETIDMLKKKEKNYDQASGQPKKQGSDKEAHENSPEAILKSIEDDFRAVFNAQDANPERVKQVQSLLQHYSQNPGYLTANALSSGFLTHTLEFMIKPDKNDTAIKDIYMENNKIFLRVVQARFLVNEVSESSGDQKNLCYISGPVESLFELDAEKGFVLKHLATDSARLAELYLGSYDNTYKALVKFQEIQNGIEKALKAEQAKLSQLLQGKDNKGKKAALVYKKIHMDVLLDTFDSYREGKLTLDQMISQVQVLASTMKGADKVQASSLVAAFEGLALESDPDKNDMKTDRLNEKTEKIKRIFFDINSAGGLISEAGRKAEAVARDFLSKNPSSSRFLSSNTNQNLANKLLDSTLQLRESFKDKNDSSDFEKQEAFLGFITTLLEISKCGGVFSRDLSQLKIMDAVCESIGKIIYNKTDIVPQIIPTAVIHLDFMRAAWQDSKKNTLEDRRGLQLD